MKRILLAIAFCSAAASVSASVEDESLSPVIVERANGARLIVDCTPPNASQTCAYFHALIRQNFSTREIGMLFGAAAAYQEYPTSYETTRERYAAFLRNIEENGLPVAANSEFEH
ncbi:MAG TPA: hypothetical protein VGH81_02030 [Rudaea sp.]|jgi:hypothetical protein